MSISDLTNTTWVFNNALTALASEDWIEFNINFVSNSTSYNSLGLDDDQQEVMKYVYYDNALETVTAYQPSGAGYTWTNDAYKTITITGGTDAVSSSAKFTTLLSWLEANATRRTFATLNLTTLNLGPGHHLIQAKSKANGFVTSEFNAQNIYYDVYQQLDTPVCTLTGTILSWAGISNADGYTLYAKQSGTTVETVSDIVASMRAYDLTQLELASGTYDIQLQAMGSGYYTDSNLSTAVSYNAMPQLGQVVNVSASGDDVSFDEVEHAERYEFVVDGTTSIGTYTPPAPIYKFHYGTQAYSYDNTSVSIDGISYGRSSTNVFDSDNIPGGSTLSVSYEWSTSGDYEEWSVYVDETEVATDGPGMTGYVSWDHTINSDVCVDSGSGLINITTTDAITEPIKTVHVYGYKGTNIEMFICANNYHPSYSNAFYPEADLTARTFQVYFYNWNTSSQSLHVYIYNAEHTLVNNLTYSKGARSQGIVADITQYIQDGYTISCGTTHSWS